jgi:extracellular factor (EF) 3-hydroxypalmitic acid methyl ester biosynthesis protein
MDEFIHLLDTTQEIILNGLVADGMNRLASGLNEKRLNSTADEWHNLSRNSFGRHPLLELVHESPFSRRAFEKPRGYAGDPVTLDYIYQLESLSAQVTPLGRAIFEWEILSDPSRGVRARRKLLAKYLNDAAESKAQPEILSVACGHLREGALSRMFTNGEFGRFAAFDQDSASLKMVESIYPGNAIEMVCGSVRGLISGEIALSGFDLIYAAGLYDYLAGPIASRLTANLFDRLNVGGCLLMINFTPDLADIGYMEACMDWRLIYRTEVEMRALSAGIPASLIMHQRCFRLAAGNLVALELRKAE